VGGGGGAGWGGGVDTVRLRVRCDNKRTVRHYNPDIKRGSERRQRVVCKWLGIMICFHQVYKADG
jgi:hypothetical protein